ncbi:MAG TPA: 1-acyl-sn-glycerol-3-phosphate acyltransferase, partial [Thermomicrobiales bacterium]|nr:1-acyl-sn-glycerol-3-phosphate acyltransferase [Thermomicrobiales bacterium]
VLRRGGRAVLSRQAVLDITGAEHIPREGPCVVVARHYHHLLDGCALYQATSRPLHILVGLDWTGSGLTRRGMETLCRMVDWPIVLRNDALEREGASASRRSEARRLLLEAMRQSIDLLAAGELVVMFPEGYPVVDPHAASPRAHPDGLLPFQPGVTRLVAQVERRLGHPVPIVPVGFRYRERERGRWEIEMRIGSPIYRDGNICSDDGLLWHLEEVVSELSGISTMPER